MYNGGATQRQMILKAAVSLEQRGKVNFTAEELVVEAWLLEKKMFGLRGFEDTYPDANKALCPLMGERGLVKSGLLQKVAPRTYKLTRTGAKEMLGEHKEIHSEQVAGCIVELGEEQEKLISRLLKDAAFQQFMQEPDEPHSLPDAYQFWSVKGPDWVSRRLNEVHKRLNEERSVTVLSNRREVTATDVSQLIECHKRLLRKFGKVVAHYYAKSMLVATATPDI